MAAPKIWKASLLSMFCTIKFNAQLLPCDTGDHLKAHPYIHNVSSKREKEVEIGSYLASRKLGKFIL